LLPQNCQVLLKKKFSSTCVAGKSHVRPHFCSMSASTPRDGKVAPVSEQRQLGIQLPLSRNEKRDSSSFSSRKRIARELRGRYPDAHYWRHRWRGWGCLNRQSA